jgi:hypothetical protein
MSDSPKLIQNKPTEAEISAAVKEYESASDRMAVVIKYPWLAQILNKTTQTK